MEKYTDIPAYSDTLGPRQKSHCSQSVTVTTYDIAGGRGLREGRQTVTAALWKDEGFVHSCLLLHLEEIIKI